MAATPSPVDKSQAGIDARQYHIGVAPGEVSTVALLPGDPFRVPLVAEFLTDVREVAHNREHRTMTGSYKGRRITATSTGMGCPSTAIAVEELARVGVTSVIRVGSSAGLQAGIVPGDLLVSEGSYRMDGTTDAYLPRGFPSVPDAELTLALTRNAERIAAAAGSHAYTGISTSSDAFYAETPELIGQLNGMGILNMEMEASAMYVIARLRGMRGDGVRGIQQPRRRRLGLRRHEAGAEGRLDALHRSRPGHRGRARPLIRRGVRTGGRDVREPAGLPPPGTCRHRSEDTRARAVGVARTKHRRNAAVVDFPAPVHVINIPRLQWTSRPSATSAPRARTPTSPWLPGRRSWRAEHG